MELLPHSSGLPTVVWSFRSDGARIRFTGRSPLASRSEVLEAVAPGAPRSIAWLEQVHGSDVLAASPGRSGAGDALTASDPEIVLAIGTADCVPVALVGPGTVGAIHAGWRGIAAGVVTEAVRALGTVTGAWIGPAIGACCYEVGADVARTVVEASTREILRLGPGEKPRLDLKRVVRSQLEDLAVPVRGEVELCTRCHPDLLHSYRGQGEGTGRNLAFVWRAPNGEETPGARGRRPGADRRPR